MGTSRPVVTQLSDIITQIQTIEQHSYSKEVRQLCIDLIQSVGVLQEQIDIIDQTETNKQVQAVEQQLKSFIGQHLPKDSK